MSDEQRINDLVREQILRALLEENDRQPPVVPAGGHEPAAQGDDLPLAKRVAQWLGVEVPLPPALQTWAPDRARASYLARSPARLGVGRAGVRYRTDTALSFLIDHAAARDAVSSDVDSGVLNSLQFVSLTSAAADKREFLVRPDLGRRLSQESAERAEKVGISGPAVQIAAVDGLSATALTVNLPLIIPPLLAAFQSMNIRTGTHFFVSNGRVAAGDDLARRTKADVLCLLVGERPGLKTAESMGAYITYMKVQHFNEAMRYVVSNIHKAGLPPVEAAAQIAELCQRALAEKKTGVDFSS